MTLHLRKGPDVSRRWLLKVAPSAGAGLVIFAGISAANAKTSAGQQRLSPFLEFIGDGRTVLTCPEAEMGQDIITGLTKTLADEIGLDWSKVEVARAHHSRDFYGRGGQNTGGSMSTRRWYKPLRDVGARIRSAFISAGAQRLNVPEGTVSLDKGIITSTKADEQIPLEALLADVLKSGLPESAPLKPDEELTLIGRDVVRKDMIEKVTGTAPYGADIRPEGLLYASVRLIPKMLGSAQLSGVKEAETMPGVVGVEPFENGVGVVADTWRQADEAAKKLSLTPAADAANAMVDDAVIDAALDTAITEAGSLLPSEAKAIRRTYSLPYLSHITLETMTATASVKPDSAQIWVSTQSPSRFANRVATMLDIPLETVSVKNMFLGGGFGRKGTDMQALEWAVRLSRKHEAPVQVMFDRPTDIVSDQYRPAAKFALAATLKKDGSVQDIASTSSTQSLARALLPQFYKKGRPEFPEIGIFPYAADQEDHRWAELEAPVSIGFWRSVGGTQYPFAGESFVDELAHEAGQDPLAFRMSKLSAHPRLAAVLRKAATMAVWDRAREKGTGLGIGLYEEWGSACAQVAEVTVKDGRVRVNHVWAAVDCGKAISPETVRMQTMGGIHCGLSAVLMGKITLEKGAAQQTNFNGYPIMDMTRSPDITVELVASDLPPGGVGEIGTPPTAPAVTNAIFAACGKRIRTLPVSLTLEV